MEEKQETRYCKYCDSEQPVKGFHGRRCKICIYAYTAEYRQRNGDQYKATRKAKQKHTAGIRYCEYCNETRTSFMFDGNKCHECLKEGKRRHHAAHKDEINQRRRIANQDPLVKAKIKAAKRQYYLNNKDRIKRKVKAHYHANIERYREYHEKYRTINKERLSRYQHQYRIDNALFLREKSRNHYQQNRDKILARNTRYRFLHREDINRRRRVLCQQNPELAEKKREQSRVYRKKNAKKIKRSRRDYYQRMKQLPEYRIRVTVAGAIRRAIKRNRGIKEGSILKFLPYTIVVLVKHIESQFEPWMNWTNQGMYIVSEWDDNNPETWKWNIDHVVPQSQFAYTSMSDQSFQDCWALSNLRPLSAKENVIKGDRY